ncbi:tripartite tricarboxylate transporter TctB family protein [Lutibaculum baratangense]|uniref:DUF1468 domain-containing protein n=1 Tax=Lutibaculum baratangense AMV1 TaxID=631454 RepID=V4QVJ3_9HYPH|nr:tripartite tricarboxylate transporter TctB family protein [Lutibaculum baratangense]ESR23782.1 hypothetical protein N177_3012 [Lutibaculum baratangense AMV1]
MDNILRRSRSWTGLVFVALGVIGLWDGYRLATALRTTVSFDQVGPGGYLIGISLGLVLAGLAAILVEWRYGIGEARQAEPGLRWRMPVLAAAFALYGVLMTTGGYPVATFAFFMVAYAVTGVRPWHRVLLAAFLSFVALQLVFIVFADMPLPMGPLRLPGL